MASVPQNEQLERKTELPLPKEKEQSHQSDQIVSWERVKVNDSRILTRKRRVRVRASSRKSQLYSEGRQAPRRRGKASKEKYKQT